MSVRAIVFIADALQGGSVILTKENLIIDMYMFNPIVLDSFDLEKGAIGKVTELVWEGSNLVAEIELKPRLEGAYMKSYPAIGVSYNNKEILSVSLCVQRNVDERIKTLEGQNKQNFE